jgi:hypothetical protein
MKKFVIPPISAEEQTPLVRALLAMIGELVEEVQRQGEEIQQMRDEISVLKGEKAKPKFKSSKMDEETDKAKDDEAEGGEKQKRPGSAKNSKTAKLAIQEDRVISPGVPVPAGSRFKGYRDFVVQGLVIKAHNIRYRLEVWQTADGKLLTGQLPEALQGRLLRPDLPLRI